MCKAYISGALTDIKNPEEYKQFYESIALLCEEISIEAYVPHLYTDPVNNPEFTPQEVFKNDKHQVSSSDLVIAYLGYPSFGVGMELAYAEARKIPIIILYEVGKRISRFPRGIPTLVAEIRFHNYEDALSQLKQSLINWKISQQVH
ncbi:MAG: nucleoside 2-deoxyribosyltransferase [Calothrix sp. FI2-JRJ7]|jgi:nucleoside 2-deoxyribosyltransferase|nr:nucleoside 2-deoxyribosyltransferase [Calothrix sp. FI2-JRJ7]